MKTGQYDINESKWSHRYLVHKLMAKTVDVSVGISYQGSDMKFERFYRYPIDLLTQQTESADYTPFN